MQCLHWKSSVSNDRKTICSYWLAWSYRSIVFVWFESKRNNNRRTTKESELFYSYCWEVASWVRKQHIRIRLLLLLHISFMIGYEYDTLLTSFYLSFSLSLSLSLLYRQRKVYLPGNRGFDYYLGKLVSVVLKIKKSRTLFFHSFL
jgi:hypothetical protein